MKRMFRRYTRGKPHGLLRLPRRIMVVGTVLVMACGFEWAYRDADSSAVRAWWTTHVTRVTLGIGLRGTLAGDSATMHAYGSFTETERTLIEGAFDSLGAAHGDSIPGFVPAEPTH